MSTSQTYVDDPQGVIEELPKGKFIIDADGIEYYKPSPEELQELNTTFLQEIQEAERAHIGFYERLRKNTEAYEAQPVGSMITIPIIRRDCDNQTSWYVNEATRPHPIFSIDPKSPAEYEIPMETGNPELPTIVLPIDAEKVAERVELALDNVLRERVKIRELFEIGMGEAIRGRGPVVIKVVFDERFHEQYVKRIKKGPLGLAQPEAPELIETLDGDPVRVYAIPADHFLLPHDEENIRGSRATIERTPLTTVKLRKEFAKKRCLVSVAKQQDILSQTGDVRTALAKDQKASVDGRYSITPRNLHDVRELFFDHWVAEEKRIVKMLGAFHATAGEFLWITRNPYRHQRAPYVAVFQKKRAFRFSGSSTAEELEPIQRLASEIFHVTLQNAIVANSTPVVVNPDSDIFDWLAENEVGPASLIPGAPEDVKSLDFGREHHTLMPEFGTLLDIGRGVSGQDKFKTGESIPGRTSPNTVSQLLEQGRTAQVATLAAFGEAYAEVIWLYLKTYKQYRPYGETIFIKDPGEKAIVDIPFNLPDEEALDNFRITLTAADELAAQEATDEHLMALMGLMDQDAEAFAKIIGPFADVNMPDTIANALGRLIERKQKLIDMLMTRARVDSKKFTVDKEMLEAIKMERLQIKQQLLAAQAPPETPYEGGAPSGQGQPPVS